MKWCHRLQNYGLKSRHQFKTMDWNRVTSDVIWNHRNKMASPISIMEPVTPFQSYGFNRITGDVTPFHSVVLELVTPFHSELLWAISIFLALSQKVWIFQKNCWIHDLFNIIDHISIVFYPIWQSLYGKY